MGGRRRTPDRHMRFDEPAAAPNAASRGRRRISRSAAVATTATFRAASDPVRAVCRIPDAGQVAMIWGQGTGRLTSRVSSAHVARIHGAEIVLSQRSRAMNLATQTLIGTESPCALTGSGGLALFRALGDRLRWDATYRMTMSNRTVTACGLSAMPLRRSFNGRRTIVGRPYPQRYKYGGIGVSRRLSKQFWRRGRRLVGTAAI